MLEDDKDKKKQKKGVTRRQVIKVGAAGAAGFVSGVVLPGALSGLSAAQGKSAQAPGQQGGGNGNGNNAPDNSDTTLGLVNGNFIDGRGFVGNAMTIKNGRIANVGQLQALGPDARVINLGGKTVIPGLINMHIHYSRTGKNAGYEARDVETAFSIAEMQQALADRRATTPAGKFICCHLGWHYLQFAERRPPTLAELDAAVSDRPVYISGRAGDISRPDGTFALTNGLGRTFFIAQGLTVDATSGRISATPETAFGKIKALETPLDDLRETYDNNAWSSNLGLTGVLDPAGSPVKETDYPALELWRQGKLIVRHRLNYSSPNATVVNTRTANMMRLMGDDLFRAGGIGETIGTRGNIVGTFQPVAQAIANAGWKLQNHTDFYSDVDQQLDAIQAVAATVPVDKFRWQLIHVFQTTQAQLDRAIGLGVGLDHECERYLDRLERGGGPNWRLNVDSGIKIGMGTDGSNFCPNNPWLVYYYAVTGVDVRGIDNNSAQKITRLEALRLFTAGSAYQNFDDDKGSFDVGKVADIAVLNQNPLTVSDAQVRKTRSVMTILGGKIVHQGNSPQYKPLDVNLAFST